MRALRTGRPVHNTSGEIWQKMDAAAITSAAIARAWPALTPAVVLSVISPSLAV